MTIKRSLRGSTSLRITGKVFKVTARFPAQVCWWTAGHSGRRSGQPDEARHRAVTAYAQNWHLASWLYGIIACGLFHIAAECVVANFLVANFHPRAFALSERYITIWQIAVASTGLGQNAQSVNRFVKTSLTSLSRPSPIQRLGSIM